MSTEVLPVKEKATRTPRSADSILQGLLKQPLAEKVKLQKALTENINKEVADMQAAANAAQELLKS
jgi:hypothetical protein